MTSHSLAVFVIFFAISEEVDRLVKALFHVFGIADAIYGMIYLYYNYKIYICVSLCLISGCGLFGSLLQLQDIHLHEPVVN